MEWSEEKVWQWLSSKSYAEKLSRSAWESTDGYSLLDLSAKQAGKLQVPTVLIPQLLKDIESLSKNAGTRILSKKQASLLTKEQVSSLTGKQSLLNERPNVFKRIANSVMRINKRVYIAIVMLVMAATYAVFHYFNFSKMLYLNTCVILVLVAFNFMPSVESDEESESESESEFEESESEPEIEVKPKSEKEREDEKKYVMKDGPRRRLLETLSLARNRRNTYRKKKNR